MAAAECATATANARSCHQGGALPVTFADAHWGSESATIGDLFNGAAARSCAARFSELPSTSRFSMGTAQVRRCERARHLRRMWSYRQQVLAAFREVEDNLSACGYCRIDADAGRGRKGVAARRGDFAYAVQGKRDKLSRRDRFGANSASDAPRGSTASVAYSSSGADDYKDAALANAIRRSGIVVTVASQRPKSFSPPEATTANASFPGGQEHSCRNIDDVTCGLGLLDRSGRWTLGERIAAHKATVFARQATERPSTGQIWIRPQT
jgi:hypothetical protein